MFTSKKNVTVPAAGVSDTIALEAGDHIVVEVHTISGKSGNFVGTVAVSMDGTNFKLVPVGDIFVGSTSIFFDTTGTIVIRSFPYIRIDNSSGTVKTALVNFSVKMDDA